MRGRLSRIREGGGGLQRGAAQPLLREDLRSSPRPHRYPGGRAGREVQGDRLTGGRGELK